MNPLTAIGMNELHPDGRQQFRNMPTPRIRLQIPQTKWANADEAVARDRNGEMTDDEQRAAESKSAGFRHILGRRGG